MTMQNVAFLRPHADRPDAIADLIAGQTPGPRAEGLFWSPLLGIGSNAIVNVGAELDALARAIAALPPRPEGARAVVGHYMGMVRTLAAAWSGHSRPTLLMAMRALKHFSDTFVDTEAKALSHCLLNMASGRGGAREAQRLIDGLIRRLAAPERTLDSVNDDVGSYLAQMAGASFDLESDTVLVTQRMQADHVHRFLLSRQLHTVAGQLAEARAQRGAYWLLPSQAGSLRKQIAVHSRTLDCVRRQLDCLHASDAATVAEAAWLQAVLPSLSLYLCAVDRIGAGIYAALVGTRSLQAGLVELKMALPGGALNPTLLLSQLAAALPAWREMSARLTPLAAGEALAHA